MKLNSKTEIVIRQILKNNGEVRFVEFYSPQDSRNHVINAERFCEVYGYQLSELQEMRL